MDAVTVTHSVLLQDRVVQALAACRAAGLHQHAYFLHRDLSFMKEVGTRLMRVPTLFVNTSTVDWLGYTHLIALIILQFIYGIRLIAEVVILVA